MGAAESLLLLLVIALNLIDVHRFAGVLSRPTAHDVTATTASSHRGSQPIFWLPRSRQGGTARPSAPYAGERKIQ